MNIILLVRRLRQAPVAAVQRHPLQAVHQNLQDRRRLRVDGPARLPPDHRGRQADASVTIATSKTQVSAIHNQLGDSVGVCVEPCRRDTFPAIALATAYLHDVKGVGLG